MARAGRGGAGRRACPRRRPSGRQAGEPALRRLRPSPGRRLRHRPPDGRHGGHDRPGHDPRHRRLPRSRAGVRPRDDRCQRPLRARRRGLRAPYRRPPLRAHLRDRGGGRAHPRARPAGLRARSRAPGRRRRSLRQGSCQEPGAPLPDRRRLRGRPRRGPPQPSSPACTGTAASAADRSLRGRGRAAPRTRRCRRGARQPRGRRSHPGFRATARDRDAAGDDRAPADHCGADDHGGAAGGAWPVGTAGRRGGGGPQRPSVRPHAGRPLAGRAAAARARRASPAGDVLGRLPLRGLCGVQPRPHAGRAGRVQGGAQAPEALGASPGRARGDR